MLSIVHRSFFACALLLVAASVSHCQNYTFLAIYDDGMQNGFSGAGSNAGVSNDNNSPYEGTQSLKIKFPGNNGDQYATLTSNKITINEYGFLEFYVKSSVTNPNVQVHLGLQNGSDLPAVWLNETNYLFNRGFASANWQLARISTSDLGAKAPTTLTVSRIIFSSYGGKFDLNLDNIVLASEANSSCPSGYSVYDCQSRPIYIVNPDSGGGSNAGGIAAGVIIAIVVVAAAIAGFIIYKKKKKNSSSSHSSTYSSSYPKTTTPTSTSQPATSHNEVSLQVRNDAAPAPTYAAPAPTYATPAATYTPPAPTYAAAPTYPTPTTPPLRAQPAPPPKAQPTPASPVPRDTHQLSTHPNPNPPRDTYQLSTHPNSKPSGSAIFSKEPSPAPKVRVPLKQTRPSGSTTVFGIPLTTVVAKDCLVPWVVQDSIDYMLEVGLREEGILRLAGSSSEVIKFKAMYDKGERVDFSTCVDVHSVADLLKRYLRELPDSLVSSETCGSLERVTHIEDENTMLATVHQIVNTEVEEAHIHTLKALMLFLNQVTQHSATNKMTSTNLALVFSPTLRIMPDVLNVFIKHAYEVFA